MTALADIDDVWRRGEFDCDGITPSGRSKVRVRGWLHRSGLFGVYKTNAGMLGVTSPRSGILFAVCYSHAAAAAVVDILIDMNGADLLARIGWGEKVGPHLTAAQRAYMPVARRLMQAEGCFLSIETDKILPAPGVAL